MTQPKTLILGHDCADLCSRWEKPLIARNVECAVLKPSAFKGADILEGYDGLLLPGGNSNIHPSLAGREHEADEPGDYDLIRDNAAIALARAAYEMDMPTLGICRGMQEIVVAHGGKLSKLEGGLHGTNYCHIGNLEKMDTPVHDITYCKGGRLHKLFKGIYDEHNDSIPVNSIHYEGITRTDWDNERAVPLRQKFIIEALAPDGVIEAISAPDRVFYIGVQPHFELQGKMHEALFREFSHHIVSRFHHREP
ncbi:MAG: gamma-glutamyl-gamma-aminobutyrate hydrolase family protein [Alphaproteobacteria bacterium]|nr:gamma-glutamyl-gamma-aminobutyrate hydrolase family protein [Alphaproteobacteria bacterium]